jgi:membrane protein
VSDVQPGLEPGAEPEGRPEAQPAPRALDEKDLALLAAVGGVPDDLTDLQRKVLDRLSPRSKVRLLWMVDNWPGRVVFRTVSGLRRLQIFDRAMTIAAQLFTSVFPIIIMGASLFGGQNASSAIGGAGLPPDAEQVLNDTVSAGGSSTFGIVGVLVVLVSATSLSRAMTRAYDPVWRHGRTKLPPKGAWRWLAAVMVLALSIVVAKSVGKVLDKVPPPDAWRLLLIFAIPAFVACYIPWMLMAGRVAVRLLAPGALMFGALMVLAHPFADHYLSTSIAVSAARFGPIGVAFTYLTYLYCVSWALLATAVLGRVLAIDPGIVGRLIRGRLKVDDDYVDEDPTANA